MQLIRALLVAAMLLPVAAAAAGAMRPLAHYTHQRWSEESDPPRPVAALAQDRHGYLWIASANGLFRFDGMRFEVRVTHPERGVAKHCDPGAPRKLHRGL